MFVLELIWRVTLQENEELTAKIEAMRSQPSPLAAAKAKQEEHISDQEKFKKLIENLQVHPLLHKDIFAFVGAFRPTEIQPVMPSHLTQAQAVSRPERL